MFTFFFNQVSISLIPKLDENKSGKKIRAQFLYEHRCENPKYDISLSNLMVFFKIHEPLTRIIGEGKEGGNVNKNMSEVT